jgi:phosphomevalonate kinase
MEPHFISPPQTTVQVLASACSKVLLTGAYLIIDPAYSGLVLATDARFHTTSKLANSISNDDQQIVVRSSQFKLEIRYDLLKGGKVAEGEGNGFVNKCIRFLLEVHKVTKGGPIERGIEVELSGDNAFYSQRDKVILCF